ncbi:hypothetical protein B0H17DRAFT_1188385 [Mycena rosella]|uniref:F-box domain-containing protein n=1 Tax=Mycena rosella TaxID=1033263 RepID=A0AAD7BIG4_MYCRO|nr:hypothetical protein B0H17DRAFT_1188385 [Mycena rosella]
MEKGKSLNGYNLILGTSHVAGSVELKDRVTITKRCRNLPGGFVIVATSNVSLSSSVHPTALAMNELAQELADQVIDWVADEGLMHMRICSLVCKRWLHRTRCHLFSTVLLTTENLRAFIDLVESSSLPILSFIRHLKLQYNGSPLDNTLLARAHLCPNLTRIRILITGHSDNARWLANQSLHSHLRSWGDASGSLSHLELVLHRPKTISVGTLTEIVSCIPKMGTLAMKGIFLAESMTSLSFTPCCLEHLVLSSPGGAHVHLSWLRAFPVTPILKSLEFSPPRSNDDAWTPVGAYFQHAGKGLRSLKVGLIYPQRTFLQYTPNLENLVFRVENPAELLEVLQSLHVSHAWIVIEVRVDGPPVGDDPIPWNALDTLLAEPQFLTLKRFRFIPGLSGLGWPCTYQALNALANMRGILI